MFRRIVLSQATRREFSAACSTNVLERRVPLIGDCGDLGCHWCVRYIRRACRICDSQACSCRYFDSGTCTLLFVVYLLIGGGRDLLFCVRFHLLLIPLVVHWMWREIRDWEAPRIARTTCLLFFVAWLGFHG
jgi:hypothetical protein